MIVMFFLNIRKDVLQMMISIKYLKVTKNDKRYPIFRIVGGKIGYENKKT